MNVTCPSCGAEMDLDVLLAHEDSRQALARLAAISLPLAKLLVQYVRLFKPATRAMAQGRFVKLVEQLLPDIERQAVNAKGRDWSAPLALWQAAFERMLEQRDKGELVLPLTTHGYLHAVIVGLADKAEAGAERATEAARRAPGAGTTTDTKTGIAPVLGAATVVHTAPPPPPDYTTPSPYAQRLKAEIESRKRAREAGDLREEDADLRAGDAAAEEPAP